MTSTAPVTSEPAVVIRPATAADATLVARLAALDSSAEPTAPLLIGTIDGAPAAAISLVDDTVVADPFQRTAALVALLRLRAEHLRGPARSPGRATRRWSISGLRGRRAIA